MMILYALESMLLIAIVSYTGFQFLYSSLTNKMSYTTLHSHQIHYLALRELYKLSAV